MTQATKTFIEQNEAKNRAAKIMVDAIEAAREELKSAGIVKKDDVEEIILEIFNAETE